MRLLEEVTSHNEQCKDYSIFSMRFKCEKGEANYDGYHFFLRTSTEYSSPQLTIEEAQGIIAARLLEVCGNYFEGKKSFTVDEQDVLEIVEHLHSPPRGTIIPFVFNVDDTEPDRYSNNPLRNSIVKSGQSAFPVSTVMTPNLKVDPEFLSKYRGSLIVDDEVECINLHLANTERYVDFVDKVKRDALNQLSKSLGINLDLPTIRMPLDLLTTEKTSDPLHLIVQESHRDYRTIETIYRLMGRSMKNKTTLLTTPHSKKGFGSKRAAKGKIVFEENLLKQIDVRYQTVKLYPNMVDPNDTSIAEADDFVSIEARDITEYEYTRTPSSPQFALYTIHSPENASISHGVGAYAGSEILKSYLSIREAFVKKLILENVPRTNLCKKAPPIFNLVPRKMWIHPHYKNIDASIGCINNLADLLKIGMALEYLDFQEDVSTRVNENSKAY